MRQAQMQDEPGAELTPPTAAGSRSAAILAAPARVITTVVGGLLMGIAMLIPGVSGGTMILAVGLYEDFIDAVADVTALRLSVRRIGFLALLGGTAAISIVLLAPAILYLLLWYSAMMFALFIGLTLGGAPLLMRMIGRLRWSVVVSIIAGFGVMVAVAAVRQGAQMPRNTAMDVASGVVGATTMVLPGISGSYMLLVLDQYDRVVGAVADLRHGNWAAMRIIIPVGIGAVIGVVGLSNLLKILLHRYEAVTLGFLLGLLLGSVLGLWPFGRTPTEKILAARTTTELHHFAADKGIAGADGLEGDALVNYIRDHWATRTAKMYTPRRIAGAIVMMGVGLAATAVLGRLGASREKIDSEAAA